MPKSGNLASKPSPPRGKSRVNHDRPLLKEKPAKQGDVGDAYVRGPKGAG